MILIKRFFLSYGVKMISQKCFLLMSKDQKSQNIVEKQKVKNIITKNKKQTAKLLTLHTKTND